MRNFTISPDTKITLYLKECYGCDRKGKFDPIRRFVLDHQIKLANFMPKRIELNPTWQEEALSLDMELPALVFENEDGEREAMPYSEFVKKINKTQSKTSKKKGSAKPRNTAKGAELERVADGTSSQDDVEVENDNGKEKDG